MSATKTVKKATGVYLDTGFGENVAYLRGLALMVGDSLAVETNERFYQVNVEKLKVTGFQGEVGTADIEASGIAINTLSENGDPIPGLTVAVKIGLVNQDLTLNVTETLNDSQTKLPEAKATYNGVVGSLVRYV